MGGLRLDSREAVLKGGASGPAIQLDNPEASLLLQAVTHTHERLKMPPQGKLPDAEIAVLSSWIKAGAYWPADDKSASAAPAKGDYVITPEQRAFWSFQSVKRSEPPAVKDAGWVQGDLDRFVLAKLESSGLKPVRQASKRTLIRRATFDLTGLPPTPEEVVAFEQDRSPDAFTKVVDRLLASPHYGERWGRYWLDVARYSDDSLNSTVEAPYANSFRYRNWVIQAFNDDMPYDTFIKAQIAGDLLPDAKHLSAGLGFYALSPEFQDDRVDATTRGFLGLTVACATCHDHKFDPIPTKDFYSLQGIFSSTDLHEEPLADKLVVETWEQRKKLLDKQQAVLDRFFETQREQVAEILASQTARYLLASRQLGPSEVLDKETLARWTKYLSDPKKDHPFLKKWFTLTSEQDLRQEADALQSLILTICDEKREVDEKNKITLGSNPDRSDIAGASLVSLDRDRYIFWRDLFEKSTKDSAGFFKSSDGIYYYGKGTVERFLSGPWKTYLSEQSALLDVRKKQLPEKYPFLQTITDKKKTTDIKIAIRGDRNNPGELAPRRFLAILSKGERKHFTEGSGRLDLAEAIADSENPLTSRVIVNRIWQHHFGRGIVGTPSNFGQLGERPTHPELLDYLASKLVQNGWKLKALHREILLSSTYALSADNDDANFAKDPGNAMLWRYNRQRLDAEALRDSVLFVSGNLDRSMGEKAQPLNDENHRRTVYGFVSRRKVDGMLALFDFPNPNSTSEGRSSTNVPLQRLFLMNSSFVEKQAEALASRFKGAPEERVRAMYRTVLARDPDGEELRLALQYTEDGKWSSYARALLGSNEFSFID